MEATTIDQLFPDVLEEIFSHMSGSDLKNCALVCKDWDDVIGSYATTMKKLKIRFFLDPDHISIGYPHRKGIKIQRSDESHRKYQHVEILIRDRLLTQLASLERFNFSQVKTLDLRFKSSGSIKLNKVMELLSRMPLLQMLTITVCNNCTFDTSNASAAHFTKIKQLNVFSGYGVQPISKIFEFIKADNLTELTYRANAKHSEAKIAAVDDFIKSKKILAKLKVSANVFTQMLQRHDFSGMNLESLHVYADGGADRSDIVSENFRKSLIANAHSLTSLSIPSSLISREVRVAIFNCLMKLTTLQIIGYGSWMDDFSPNDISPNLSLKTLKMNRVGTIDGLKVILQLVPQLKNLRLGRVTDVIMKEVATSAPRLVELRIDTLEENLTGEQRFNELKSLRIGQTYNVDSFASLLERCPKIEVFERKCYDIENPGMHIEILLQHKTLKHLICGSCCSTAERQIIFDKLKINFGNLKSLGLRRSDGKFISFDFPENPAEWNVEEAEARFSEYGW